MLINPESFVQLIFQSSWNVYINCPDYIKYIYIKTDSLYLVSATEIEIQSYI